MSKNRKAQGQGKKKARDLKTRELDAGSARSVAGGKVTMQDLSFTTKVNKSSPSLG